MPSIYRITYPNGRIYVGKDLTDTVNYFGSVNNDLIHADFPPEETMVFTVKKEILFRSESPEEVGRRESEFIRKNRSTSIHSIETESASQSCTRGQCRFVSVGYVQAVVFGQQHGRHS